MSFDASAAEQDFELTEGDDNTFTITREKSDGTPYDITNWTFWLTIKTDPEDTDANAVVQKQVTNHTDPTNGETQINLTNSDTSALQGNYQYDMQHKNGSGEITTFMTGTIYFEPDTTETT